MMHVIAWELRRRKTALLWWTIASVILTVGIMALYPSIRDQAAQMNQVINQLPPELRGLKTGGSKAVDVGDPREFLNSQLFYATLPIIWIIMSITRGAGTLGAEEHGHTLELLLSRPISRTKLVLSKLIELFLEFTLVAGTTLAVIILTAPLFGLHVGNGQLAVTTLYTALFSLSFGMIAFSLQAASRLTKRSASVVAVIYSFGGYIIASLSSLTDWLETAVKFVPFHYFTPLSSLNGDTPRALVIYLVAVYLFGTVLAVVGFRHRDIE